MDFLKELFGDGALSYDQLSAKVTERGFKIADLSSGGYVAKKKYDDEVTSKDTMINDLTAQIKSRDKDISNLKKQLEDTGTDSTTKLADLTAQITKLQGDYDNAKKEYEGKLSKQSYEFAVKEFAGDLKFTSNAAKRDFINEMLSAQLKMKDNTIIGATDFMEAFKKDNSDAFVVEKKEEEPKPKFGQPTPSTPSPEENPFIKAFNFQA